MMKPLETWWQFGGWLSTPPPMRPQSGGPESRRRAATRRNLVFILWVSVDQPQEGQACKITRIPNCLRVSGQSSRPLSCCSSAPIKVSHSGAPVLLSLLFFTHNEPTPVSSSGIQFAAVLISECSYLDIQSSPAGLCGEAGRAALPVSGSLWASRHPS